MYISWQNTNWAHSVFVHAEYILCPRSAVPSLHYFTSLLLYQLLKLVLSVYLCYVTFNDFLLFSMPVSSFNHIIRCVCVLLFSSSASHHLYSLPKTYVSARIVVFFFIFFGSSQFRFTIRFSFSLLEIFDFSFFFQSFFNPLFFFENKTFPFKIGRRTLEYIAIKISNFASNSNEKCNMTTQINFAIW